MLVNGARCTVRQWDAIVDELNDRHTVIRHDVRGYRPFRAGSP